MCDAFTTFLKNAKTINVDKLRKNLKCNTLDTYNQTSATEGNKQSGDPLQKNSLQTLHHKGGPPVDATEGAKLPGDQSRKAARKQGDRELNADATEGAKLSGDQSRKAARKKGDRRHKADARASRLLCRMLDQLDDAKRICSPPGSGAAVKNIITPKTTKEKSGSTGMDVYHEGRYLPQGSK